MKVKNKGKEYFYSSLEALDTSQLKMDIDTILRMGYGNIIIIFYDIENFKNWIRNEALKDLVSKDMEVKPNIIFRFHLTSGEETADSKKVRRLLSRLTRLEKRYNIKLIKSIDETLSNVINPNIMEYYDVKLIRLEGFRWGVLKRFHQHKVYFEVVLDRLFKESGYMEKALPRLEPLEKMGKLVFTQFKPIVKPEETPYILSALTERRYASYGPIIRWGDLIW